MPTMYDQNTCERKGMVVPAVIYYMHVFFNKGEDAIYKLVMICDRLIDAGIYLEHDNFIGT